MVNNEERDGQSPINLSIYGQALNGEHPSIRVPRERLSGSRRTSLAVHLLQRDIFTPICTNLANSILALPPKDILEAAADFKTRPHFAVFLESNDSYQVILDQLVRYKYRNEGYDYMLAKFRELDDLSASGEMGYKDKAAYFPLYQHFLYTDADVVEKYRGLLAALRTRALNGDEHANLQSYEQILIRDENDRSQEIVKKLDIPSDPLELDGFMGLMGAIGYNAKILEDKRLKYGRYKTFYWALTESENGHFTDNSLIAPIGEYGPVPALNIMIATRVMVKLADRFSTTEAEKIARDHPDLVANRTTRGLEEISLKSPNPPLSTLQEGITSIGNAFSLMTARRRREFKEPDGLVKAIIDQKLVNQLARILYSGFLQPTLFSGRYVTNLLTIHRDGRITFSEPFRRLMQHEQWFFQHGFYKGKFPQFTGYGCPVSSRGSGYNTSGIEALSNAFLYIFNTIPTPAGFKDFKQRDFVWNE